MASIYSKIKNRFKFNSSRVYLQRFLEDAAKAIKTDSLVLDAGAGDGRYKQYFPHAQYESADICELERNYGKINYVCSLNEIPVEDQRFDAVICTQVLEHIDEPSETLDELFRVLKPGGTLFLTAPLYYPEHEIPYDFYRYTQFGFRHLFEKAGYKIDSINWLEGYYMTLSNQLWIASDELKVFDKKAGLMNIITVPLFLFAKITFPLISHLLGRLDLISKVTDRGHCKNYAIIATKPN